MKTAETLWALEKAFWTGDAAFYEAHLASDCVMAFPQPGGLLSRQAIIESIGGSRRWRDVTFTGHRFLHLAEGAVVLAYEASAQREDEASIYRALVCSAYRQRGSAWELVFHQQTPS